MGHRGKRDLTPADVKRSRTGKAVRYDTDNASVRITLDGDQERLQCRCANAKEYQNVDHQEFVVSRHDQVVKRGKSDNRMTLLSDEQQE